MHWLLATLLGLTACNFKRVDEKEPEPDDRVEALETLFQETKASYEKLTEAQSYWPSVEDCDATLWAGMVCAAGVPVNIGLAEYRPGEIHRRPYKACWDNGKQGSNTTVSRDMLVGYMWCGWRAKNLGAMQRLADYGEAHGWKMGDGEPESMGRVYLLSNGYGTLGRIIDRLSDGEDSRSYRKIPPTYFPVVADYERHLQALQIVLGGEVGVPKVEVPLPVDGDRDIYTSELETLKKLVDGAPDDATFQAALAIYTGDFEDAITLLLDPGYVFPSYVRGHENYKTVHWLYNACLVLRAFKGENACAS